MPHLGVLLLGIWLIASGLGTLLHINIPYSAVILPALAVVAGVMLLFEVKTSTLVLVVALVALIGGLAILAR
jgi:hypothetical protein